MCIHTHTHAYLLSLTHRVTAFWFVIVIYGSCTCIYTHTHSCTPSLTHSPYYIHTARNKDNSWPEEMIALMKEVKAKDKEKSKPLQGRYDCTADLGALGTTQPKRYVYLLF